MRLNRPIQTRFRYGYPTRVNLATYRYPFVLLQISVLHESPLGHLRYSFRCAAPAKLPT